MYFPAKEEYLAGRQGQEIKLDRCFPLVNHKNFLKNHRVKAEAGVAQSLKLVELYEAVRKSITNDGLIVPLTAVRVSRDIGGSRNRFGDLAGWNRIRNAMLGEGHMVSVLPHENTGVWEDPDATHAYMISVGCQRLSILEDLGATSFDAIIIDQLEWMVNDLYSGPKSRELAPENIRKIYEGLDNETSV
jgi:hypothetical protein